MFDSDKQKKANKKTYKISTDGNSFPSLYVETGWESSSYGSSTVVWMAHRPAKEFHVRMEAKKKSADVCKSGSTLTFHAWGNRKEWCAQTPLPESGGGSWRGRGKSPGNNSWKISRFPFPADAHSLCLSLCSCLSLSVSQVSSSFPPQFTRQTATALRYWLLYLLLLLYYPTERTIKSGAKLLSKTQLYRAGN